jgi:hypothetical protein
VVIRALRRLVANVGNVLLEPAAAAAATMTAVVHACETGAESGHGSEREKDHQKRSSHFRSPQTE